MRDGDRLLRLGGTKGRSVLAILLLHAGEPVSVDRLIDGVWGEAPPADAPTALHQHVSRLRRALEPHRVIETRAPGYAAALPDDALDLRRFERADEEGRALLAAGRADDAARVLRGALEMWRGRPLADLENEPFAAEAVARLDEAWVATLERRVEADLALGRHADLIGELRALARRHPLRERLRGQLMLALYRSGRQAEALAVYAEARQTLVDELGLEPGPELQRLQAAILRQDASLELGAAASAPPPEGRGGRRGLAAAVAVVAAALAVTAAALLALRSEGGSPVAAHGGTVVAIDAASGETRQRIPAGRTPAAIAAAGGSVWVVDGDARTLLRVDGRSYEVETLATGGTPADVAAVRGSVWVAHGQPLEDAQFIGPVATRVARFDAATRTQRAEVRLPPAAGDVSNSVENRLAVAGDAVWAVTPGFDVVRIESSTGTITARTGELRAVAVAAGPAGVWALAVDGTVARLHERTARPLVRARIPATTVTAIAVGDDAAWVTSATDGTLWRIGSGEDPELGTVELTPGASDVAAAAGSVWVVNPVRGTLIQVDAARATVERTVSLEGIPRSVAVDGGVVWVATVDGPVAGATDAVRGVRPLPPSVCEPPLAGAGEADLLVVSDLPLQGGIRVTATQMAQAIEFVLRERRFRAGRFRVAYQSCDDSIASTGLFDEAKCAANARAYGANPDVIGVIGTLNSPCAAAALPELNSAPGGAVPMVSPLNSFVGLTRSGPGVPPALPAALYPTGTRNYVRVHPTDDLQGAALALLAQERGRARVFVLDDGEPGYGVLMATGFETAARRLGLTVAGRESWQPEASGYGALAARVAGSGATAVFLGGLLDSNAARVVRDLRARLGDDVDLLAPDGLTPLPLLVEQAGPATRGVFVALGGVVPERLPPAGARFARRFGRTQPGAEVEPAAVYAAQATEVLLDAIARSDGTRSSVVEGLFRTRVEGGLLGSFTFDRNGDISESPVTIVRVARGGTSRRLQSVEGGEIVRVVRPSAALVAADG